MKNLTPQSIFSVQIWSKLTSCHLSVIVTKQRVDNMLVVRYMKDNVTVGMLLRTISCAVVLLKRNMLFTITSCITITSLILLMLL